jgi:hypothetical protein
MGIVPRSFNYVQQPGVQYNKPVSEASLEQLGGPINGLLSIMLPVGSIIHSMLTEIQFQDQIGNPSPATWVLADGRDVTGSLFTEVTGFTLIPDLRGIFVRGKNNGRSDGHQNPDGDLALGTYTGDKFASHLHTYTYSRTTAQISNNTSGGVINFPYDQLTTTENTSSAGGNETAPKNVTVNIFIRIN